MSAQEALIAYGYKQDKGGRFVKPGRPRTQEWQPVDDGYERYDGGTQIPFRGLTREEAEEQGDGAKLDQHNMYDPTHRDLFIWIWPDEYVEKIYAAAIEADKPEEEAGE